MYYIFIIIQSVEYIFPINVAFISLLKPIDRDLPFGRPIGISILNNRYHCY